MRTIRFDINVNLVVCFRIEENFKSISSIWYNDSQRLQKLAIFSLIGRCTEILAEAKIEKHIVIYLVKQPLMLYGVAIGGGEINQILGHPFLIPQQQPGQNSFDNICNTICNFLFLFWFLITQLQWIYLYVLEIDRYPLRTDYYRSTQ